MSLGFHYNGDGTVTVTCGDHSVTIRRPADGGTRHPSPRVDGG